MTRASKKERKAFDTEVIQITSEILKTKNKQFVSEDNVMQFRHGNHWSLSDSVDTLTESNTFLEHSSEFSLHYASISRREVSSIQDFVQKISNDMHSKLASTMFSAVDAATEKTGNKVEIGPLQQTEEQADIAMHLGFLEMANKIELGVNRYGGVSYPSLFVHPENTRVLNLIGAPVPSDIQQQIDLANHRKELEAISTEALRYSRFKI